MSPGASTADAPLDVLSHRLLAAVPGLRVAVAVEAEQRAAIYRLRRQHIVASGWARAQDLPDDGEYDEHDAHALQIGAWTQDADRGVARGGGRGGLAGGSALIGAIRLVLPAPGRLLPVEAEFGLRVEPAGAVAEAGRLVIAHTHRGDPAHRAWGALFARVWLELRERNMSVLAGAASPAMVARLRALGLPFEVLGPAREHWGELRHPVRLDPADGAPRWYQGGVPSGAGPSTGTARSV